MEFAEFKGTFDEWEKLKMKEDLLKLFDEGSIKIGQRVPMMQTIAQINKETFTADIIQEGFEEITITQELIKRIRHEIFVEHKKNW